MTGGHVPPATGFDVDRWAEWVGGSLLRHRRFWTSLASIESRLLAPERHQRPVTAPVWVCGLARSGTTTVLEALSRCSDVAFQRYRDYPFLFTPYFWSRLLRLMPKRRHQPLERTHRDRIRVTPDSPEAMEEPLWMAFWPGIRSGRESDVLGADARKPAFESFFREHIEKVTLAGGASRYLAKGNYNVTRLAYLLKMFPDARFIVMVRDPVTHVGSLMRQHRIFSEGLVAHPAARAHLRNVGHFEFGPDRAPIHCGNPERVQAILEARRAGQEARAWAIQWAEVYGLVARQLREDAQLAGAVRIMRFEDLCERPLESLIALSGHGSLKYDAQSLDSVSRGISAPHYYDAGLSRVEQQAVRDEAGDVARKLGYARG